MRTTPTLYWIDTPGPGRLGVSPRPRGGDWLEDEVTAWRAAGVDVVASLLTPTEVEELALEDEPRLAISEGIDFSSYAISDREIPECDATALTTIARLAAALEGGKTVLVHCRQGIGRAGMIAAATLTCLGLPVEGAIRRTSVARGLEIPETAAQLAWLHRMADRLAVARR